MEAAPTWAVVLCCTTAPATGIGADIEDPRQVAMALPAPLMMLPPMVLPPKMLSPQQPLPGLLSMEECAGGGVDRNARGEELAWAASL